MMKEPYVSMRGFNARFNKLIKRIPTASAPTGKNKKTFYINSMPPDLGYKIRRENLENLEATQMLVVEMEDDMIASSMWKRELQYVTIGNAAGT
jgi:hypothetical protein